MVTFSDCSSFTSRSKFALSAISVKYTKYKLFNLLTRSAKNSPLLLVFYQKENKPKPTTSIDRGSKGTDTKVEGKCRNLLALQMAFFQTLGGLLGVDVGVFCSCRMSD